MTMLEPGPPFSRDLRRSVHLFTLFRRENDDPEAFYSSLADDTTSLVAQYETLGGRRVLDVGSGPGYFSDAFRRAGASCCTVELDLEVITTRDSPPVCTIAGDGQQMPIPDGAFDICHSSNAIEHVPRPRDFLSEMIRVVRPGGLVFLAFTNWYSPFGGHETSPWHYLGGDRAALRYERTHGRPPTNRYGVGLFRLGIGEVLGWARGDDRIEIVDTFPRYYPGWARWITRVPGLREVATWNLVLVLRKR
jgi:SAM-dependent methyltransferase